MILKGIGGFYTVQEDGSDRRHTLRAQSKLRRQRLTPMVGDRVRFTPSCGEEHGWVEAILPRANQLLRPPVANVDLVVLVAATASPDPDLLLIDRMLLCAAASNIPAVVAVNKADLNPERGRAIARQYAGAAPVIPVSARTGEGVEALRRTVRSKVHAFGGQSGVGKSTLINALYGLNLKAGEVSGKILRGKHTTRHCELMPVADGGMVLDTPGFSLLELPLIEPILLKERYPEFGAYEGRCRFQPCAHRSEPGCAVRDATEAGRIDPERFARYQALFDEMMERWRGRYG